MIREVAHVNVLAGHHADFEQDLNQAVNEILSQATGLIEFTGVGWCVERPDTYLFTIDWETLEDHTVGFRESELFTRWRELIGKHFDGPPTVEHFTLN
jgi:heme-degrading monooxygenase HmoA